MLTTLPTRARRQRSPQHTFNIKHAPYVVQPFMIAPVLPGETMDNLSVQSRCITNPLKSALVGWWLEHYFFYVKLRDLDWYFGNSLIEEMIIGGGALTSHTAYRTAAANAHTYWHAGGSGTGMDWVEACMRAIMFTYFRDKDADYNEATIDSLPAAYLQHTTAFQNAVLEATLDTATDVSIPVDAAPAPDTVSVRDVVTAMETYQLLQQRNLVEASFEDWLRSYGVNVGKTPENRPELIRYSRDFTYPSSHVVPDTTTAGDSDVTSACSWSIAERADKKRFFREPGFIIGLSCCRPKVYLSNQKRPLVSLLTETQSWLPAVLLGDPNASWKKNTDAATDILGGVGTGDWWIDLKDMFIYGDQFTNNDLATVVDMNVMALPAADLDDQKPVQASVDALFVSGDATGGVRQDGIVRLTIASHLADTSPRGSTGPLVA